MSTRSTRRSHGPIGASVLLAAGLVALWSLFVAPELPPHLRLAELEMFQDAHLVDGLPARYHATHDPRTAKVFIVGDSRVYEGISERTLAAGGVPNTTIVWDGGAQLEDLLDAVRAYPSRKLVTSLTPLGLYWDKHHSSLDAELLELPAPGSAEEMTLADIETWSADATRALQGRGHESAQLERQIGLWKRGFRHVARSQRGGTARIDQQLSDAADLFRRIHVRSIGPAFWDRGWVEDPRPGRSTGIYQRHLHDDARDERVRAALRIREQLRQLKRDGWEIVCIRMPTSRSLRQIEDSSLPPDALLQLCRSAGVRFWDDSRKHYSTRDGSHLMHPDALEYSASLAERISAELGW